MEAKVIVRHKEEESDNPFNMGNPNVLSLELFAKFTPELSQQLHNASDDPKIAEALGDMLGKRITHYFIEKASNEITKNLEICDAQINDVTNLSDKKEEYRKKKLELIAKLIRIARFSFDKLPESHQKVMMNAIGVKDMDLSGISESDREFIENVIKGE